MPNQTYQQLIIEGTKDLPPEALAEIIDFIFFVRKRVLQPRDFEEELRNVLLEAELKLASQEAGAHLEEEFESYDQRYPRE